MLIKKTITSKKTIFEDHKKSLKVVYAGLVLSACVVGLLSGFFFKFKIDNFLDNKFSKLGFPSDIRHNGLLSEIRKGVSFLNFNPLSKTSPLPQLDIEIKFKHLIKLYNKKSDALDKGALISEDDDFVPATINSNGRKIKAKLRLKGDMLDHLEGRKWSYRVKVKGSDHFDGMRVFSIQHPMTRGYHWEPIFYSFLREFKIITPRYYFTNVTINGEDIGIMAIEEHFSKEILESQAKREGAIVRFDESNARAGLLDNSAHSHFATSAHLKAFRMAKVEKNKNILKTYHSMMAKVLKYQKEEIPLEEILDIKQMAYFSAAAEVWNAEHGLWWTNMRFYINPITMKLEPIAFDNESLHFEHRLSILSHNIIGIYPISNFLKNEKFQKEYLNALLEISSKLEKNINKYKEMEKEYRQSFSSEFPFIFKIPFDSYLARVNKLKSITDIREFFYVK